MGVEDATEIRRLLGYKDGTAGGMMTTQFVAVAENRPPSGDTIEVLRELPEDHPTVHYRVRRWTNTTSCVGVCSPAHARAAPTTDRLMCDSACTTT